MLALLLLLTNAVNAEKCRCLARWTSPSDGGNCGDIQYGCSKKSCVSPWLWDPWCITANPGCDEEEDSDGGGWHYCDPEEDPGDAKALNPKDLEPCRCLDSWRSPEDGGDCGNKQSGCPGKSCVEGYYPWCITANAPCREEELSEGGGWHYCEPDEELPRCECKNEWTSPEDGGNCGRIQNGCPDKSCVAPWLWKTWCITANSPCKEEQVEDGGGWHYCTKPGEKLEKCKCKDRWTSLEDGGNCGNVQNGCPSKSCVDPWRWDPWCITANSPCLEEEHTEGGGWHYCDPDDESSEAVESESDDESGQEEETDKCSEFVKAKKCKKAKGCTWLGRGKDGQCYQALACATGKNKKKCRALPGCKWEKRGKTCTSG